MTINRWQASSRGVYRWGSKFRATIAVNFDFSVNEYEINTNSFGFEIENSITESSYPKMNGHVAPSTQDVVNNLPLWTKGRIDPESNIFMFANSFGQHIDYVSNELDREQNNQFISLADQKEIDRLYKITDEKIYKYINQNQKFINNLSKNLVRNSFFALKAPARLNKAKYWTGQYSLSNESLYGSSSVVLNNGNTIQQYSSIDLSAGSKLCFSFFYKTDSNVNSYDEYKFSSLIHLIYNDGTIKIERKAIAAYTGDIWKRHDHSIVLSKPIIGFEIQVFLKNHTSINSVSLDCLQLENGSEPTEWNPDIFFNPSYLGTQILPIVVAGNKNKKHEVFISSDRQKFLYRLPPTRIKKIDTLPEGEVIQNNIWSRFAEYTRDSWISQWIIHNNSLARENVLVPGEIPFVYQIAEDDLEKSSQYSLYTDVTRTLMSLTIHDNLIFLLAKEVTYGVTKYVIKFINPYVSKYSKDYLECFSDLEINLAPYIQDISTTSQDSSENYQIALFNNTNKYLLIKLPNSQILVFRLYYDYGYIDTNVSSIYCKENYSLENKVLTIFG